MNRYSIIMIAAIIAIIAPFAYWGTSVVGVSQMEYRWSDPSEFSFFAMSNHGDIELCNTMPFWMSFEGLEIGVFFEGKHRGSYSTEAAGSVTIGPASSTVQKGTFTSEELSASQHVFMTFDFEFNGGDIRLDPNQLVVVMQTHTPILGIVPYSTTVQIPGFDFDQTMKSKDLFCN